MHAPITQLPPIVWELNKNSAKSMHPLTGARDQGELWSSDKNFQLSMSGLVCVSADGAVGWRDMGVGGLLGV
jgi:hypothetical protein